MQIRQLIIHINIPRYDIINQPVYSKMELDILRPQGITKKEMDLS
jgi:hypothetical protein